MERRRLCTDEMEIKTRRDDSGAVISVGKGCLGFLTLRHRTAMRYCAQHLTYCRPQSWQCCCCFPVVNVPIFLILGGLASRAHLSDDHGLLLTSTGWISVCGSTVTQKSVGEHDMDSTTDGSTIREG